MAKKRQKKPKPPDSQPRAQKTAEAPEPPADGPRHDTPPQTPRPKAAAKALPPRKLWLLLAAVAGAAFLAYANTLNADFTYDDIPIVRDKALIRSLGNLPEIFRTNYWGLEERFPDKSLYRPLTIASYALNHAVHGLRPAGYHVVNVLLHAGVSVLVLLLVLELSSKWWPAFASGLLFAVHPIHTEAVSGIVGRAEILACAGIVGAALAYQLARRESMSGKTRGAMWSWVAVSVVAYLAGMLSKETGVLAVAVIILSEWVFPDRRWLFRGRRGAFVAFGGYLLVFGIYWALRSNAVLSKNINMGFAGVTQAERVATALRVGLEYVGLLLFPAVLSADYWISDVPIARGIAEPGVLGALAVLALLAGAVVWGWRRLPAGAWGLCLFAGILFPVSNLPFPIGVLKAERLLYTPSVGVTAAVAAVLGLLWERRRLRPASWAVLAAVTLALTVRTWVRNRDWRDNITLATASIRTSPTSMTFNTILATWHRDNGRNAEARERLLQVLIDRPTDRQTLFNLGNIELDEGNTDKSIDYYRRAEAVAPLDGDILNNLARAFSEAKRFDEAVATFLRMKEVAPKHPGPYVNLMALYLDLKEVTKATALTEEALQRFPNLAAVHWNAAAVYKAAGRMDEARAAHARAVKLEKK